MARLVVAASAEGSGPRRDLELANCGQDTRSLGAAQCTSKLEQQSWDCMICRQLVQLLDLAGNRGRRDLRRCLPTPKPRAHQPMQPLPSASLVTRGSAPRERAVPKLREGSYFLDWILERRRRSEVARVA